MAAFVWGLALRAGPAPSSSTALGTTAPDVPPQVTSVDSVRAVVQGRSGVDELKRQLERELDRLEAEIGR